MSAPAPPLTMPCWHARFAEPLLDQIIALVQRDQAAAMAIVNPAVSDPIVQFHKGFAPRVQLPHFTVWAHGSVFSLTAQSTRRSSNKISVVIDVGSSDQELAQELAWQWGRIIDIILTSAIPDDWVTPLAVTLVDQPEPTITAPPAFGSLLAVIPLQIGVSTAQVDGMDKPVVRVEWMGQFELEET